MNKEIFDILKTIEIVNFLKVKFERYERDYNLATVSLARMNDIEIDLIRVFGTVCREHFKNELPPKS